MEPVDSFASNGFVCHGTSSVFFGPFVPLGLDGKTIGAFLAARRPSSPSSYRGHTPFQFRFGWESAHSFQHMDGGSRPKFQHHRPATSVVRLEAVFLKSPALQRQQGRDPNRCKANPRVENHAPLPRALTTNMRVSTHEAAVGPTYPTHLGLPFCSRSPSSSEAHTRHIALVLPISLVLLPWSLSEDWVCVLPFVE